jgi:hypothetical protein
MYTTLPSPIHATCPDNLNLFYFITRTIMGETAIIRNLWSRRVKVFLHAQSATRSPNSTDTALNCRNITSHHYYVTMEYVPWFIQREISPSDTKHDFRILTIQHIPPPIKIARNLF